MDIHSKSDLLQCIKTAVDETRIVDIHTHLFSECFGGLFLYGIDELLTYHYLLSETFRHIDLPYEKFFSMSKREQADIVWKALFIDNTPISEAAKSIITVFNKLGLDVNRKDLNYYRGYFASVKLEEYIDRIFKEVGLQYLVMTNDPFDDAERDIWLKHYKKDDRFKAALRLDYLLNSCEAAFEKLRAMGYETGFESSGSLSEHALSEIRRFINTWIDRYEAIYCAASLQPSFAMNDGSIRSSIIENCVIPVCRSRNIPFAFMIGVNRGVNPQLGLAGDSIGKADIKVLEYLCAKYPGNKFMITMLSRENQHELAVTARKFRNLMVFGCWWFVNIPSTIEEITRIRFELLGTSFIPQHSDCRVFEQLISKWTHSKDIIVKVLSEKYSDLSDQGYVLTEAQIKGDVDNLFGGNFESFLRRKL